MGIDIKIDNGESHFNRPLKVTWKGTGILPFLEELVIPIDPFLDLSKVGPSSQLPEELSFVELEGFSLLEIGTILDGSDSKTEGWEPLAVLIGDGKKNLPWH